MTPQVDVSKPKEPKMGGVTQLSKDEWAAWTGGKPLSTWTGLDPSASTEAESPNQLRPVHAGSQVKSHNHRKRGMEVKFGKDDDIIAFQVKVWDHLQDCGMDTIACVSDPADGTMMRSIVTDHSRHTKDLAKASSDLVVVKFDAADKQNAKGAKAFLLDSLEENLHEKLQERIKEDDSFVIVWMTLIERIQSTSLERFESLKKTIRDRLPSNCPGKNLDLMASDMRRDLRILEKAGQLDCALTHRMIQSFMTAGGKGLNGDACRSRIRPMELLVEAAVLKTACMSKDDAKACMTAEKLTHDDVCDLVEKTHIVFINSTPSRWDPATTPGDRKAPPAAFGNVASARSPEALALIQSGASDPGPNKKGTKCFNCGKEGHWSRECPDPPNPNRGPNRNSRSGGRPNNGSRRSSKKDGSRGVSWKHQAPAPGQSESKTMNGRTFEWCGKCSRWSTTHNTASHTGKSRTEGSNGQAVGHLSLCPDPSAWLMMEEPEPCPWMSWLSLLMGGTFVSLLVMFAFQALDSEMMEQSQVHLSVVGLIELFQSHAWVLAPLGWMVAILISLWRPKAKPPPNKSRKTRRQRRAEERWSRKATKPSGSVAASIRTTNLHRKHPLRLRSLGHCVKAQPPTLEAQQIRNQLDSLNRSVNKVLKCVDLRGRDPLKPNRKARANGRALQGPGREGENNGSKFKTCKCHSKWSRCDPERHAREHCGRQKPTPASSA